MRDTEDLFRALLDAPDRDDPPLARPVLSFRDDDPRAFVGNIQRHSVATWDLTRRGVWHGKWAELDASSLKKPKPASGRRLRAAQQRRWHVGQSVPLPGAVPVAKPSLSKAIRRDRRLHEELTSGAALASWLDERLWDPFHAGAELELTDPQRDLARRAVEVDGSADAGLWVKIGRLSTHPDDASLRLRISFGDEGTDDAARDPARHRLVRRLAEGLFPPAELAVRAPWKELLDSLCAGPTTTTQHILYWNAPGGGALFHHDAFDEPPEDRQLGVAYVQLSGATAWLALSLEELAHRVTEFGEALGEGEMAWVREELFPTEAAFADFRKVLESPRDLQRELLLPGCGTLAGLVNRGPEFTCFLADAGHALVLHPGDVLLLPNQNPACTAMHSVFCASPHVALGLSMALRAAR